MNSYTDDDRKKDFNFFVQNYQELFQKYGCSFIAIKNKNILGSFCSVVDAINTLSDKFDVGTYIIQECTGKESAYMTRIMRLMIRG